MRKLFLVLAALSLVGIDPAAAQQPAGGLAADHKDVGKIEARVQKYDHALGVISELHRTPAASAVCDGVCYFPNSSKSISWKCEPDKRCDLRCTVSPPVGGCD